MNNNPYLPPSSSATQPPELTTREVAALRLRTAIFILAIPAAYNLIAFAFSPSFHRRVIPMPPFFQIVNCVGFIVVTAVVWWLALPTLELLTTAIHAVLSRRSPLTDWKEALYRSLRSAPLLASFGGLLWIAWIVGFYMFALGFYFVSIPLAISGHVLAACLYVPLIYRWYQLEHSASPN